MASLKEIRRRIRSVKSTQQITKAMEMVAAAKLRRAQTRALAARPYATRITHMLGNLAGAASDLEHPLFKAREVKRAALVVVTSDRGLAGAYNANVIRAAERRHIIFEPGPEAIFETLLPRYAPAKLFAALADSLASEHGSRMIAMGSARKNAGEMLDMLVLRRNRLRQAAITKEIAEIVGGA